MTRVWRLCMLVAFAVIVAACGRPNILSLEKATALAIRQTPLTTVQDAMTTPPGPVMWCLLGADKSGRPMAVWVARQVEGQVYVDAGTSPEAAVKAAGVSGPHRGTQVALLESRRISHASAA